MEEKKNEILSDEDYLKLKCEIANERSGNLKNYDCPKCKNKGFIYIIKNESIFCKECDCMKKRKTIQEMFESGITQEMFNNYSFEKYKTDKDYQKIIYNQAKEYIEKIVNGSDNWFYIGGISGIGKTHICTAIVKELLKKEFNCKYLLWKNELPKLKMMRKSFDETQQRDYYNIIKIYSNIDILYIDDFFKFLDTKNNDELDIAYEIINARYCNNKITIISSEYNKEDLCNIDLAIGGRIVERSKGYFIQPLKTLERNYRLNN